MSINLHLPNQRETLKPKITVIGVGGAGGNAVNNMIASNLEGAEFVMANTDAQALEGALTDRVIQLGATVTRGLGAGASPDVGCAAAEEAEEEVSSLIEGASMVFITAGMGGGTGTGAAPVIARIAKEQGILTIGVVTKPFQFEGANRMRIADRGIEELQQYVDTLIVIPNQNLFRIANEKTTFAEAFRMADDVLHSGVRGVTDLMVKPGLVNLDFADIRSVMSEMGKAMMGTGEAEGERRAIEASEAAISNPLLDDVSLKGARAVLINITGGPDMTLFEVDEAANRIRDEVDANANIIFGSTFADSMQGKMRVAVVATGIDVEEMANRPVPQNQGAGMGANGGQKTPKPISIGGPIGLRHTADGAAPAMRMPAVPVKQERSAAEIVRQAGNGDMNDFARAMPPKRPVSMTPEKPPISAQGAPAGMVHAADEAAMAASSDAGPLFVSPRAEQPAQRTLHQADQETSDYVEEEFVEETMVVEADAAPSSSGLFSKLKAFASSKNDAALKPATSEPETRRAAVCETQPSMQEEEEYYDIPAFLRRQAN
jgi:cell division protein FtsZ